MRSHLRNPISWQSTTGVKTPLTANILDSTTQGRPALQIRANFFDSPLSFLYHSHPGWAPLGGTTKEQERKHLNYATWWPLSTGRQRWHSVDTQPALLLAKQSTSCTCTSLTLSTMMELDTQWLNCWHRGTRHPKIKLAGQLAWTVGWQLVEKGGWWATVMDALNLIPNAFVIEALHLKSCNKMLT